MATFLTPLLSLSSYHLIAWGSLLGMELYQSFVITKLCYIYLPSSQFTTLQKRVFPVYFAYQTTLVAATAITYPAGSLLALVENRADSAVLGATLGISALNWLVFGPKTSQLMMKRSHQKTWDKQNEADGTVADELAVLKQQFSRSHAMTIHLNLLAIVGTVVYGAFLSVKIA